MIKTPEELRGALVSALRNGELDRDLANEIADMLEHKAQTPFRMKVERSKAGNPDFGKFDIDMFRSVEKAIEDFPGDQIPSWDELLNFVAGKPCYGKLTEETDRRTVEKFIREVVKHWGFKDE